ILPHCQYWAQRSVCTLVQPDSRILEAGRERPWITAIPTKHKRMSLPPQHPVTNPARQLWPWLLLAQLPAVLGMIAVGAIMAAVIPSDPFGGTAAAGVMATFAGSLLSTLISLCAYKTPLR